MRKVLFYRVLRKVCELSELPYWKVMYSNEEDSVDARYAMISSLSEMMSDRQISEISGWSIQMVNKARNAFSQRCTFRWGLRDMFNKLKSFIKE